MKAVLISIQPKWVEKIASGKKTIEVRKTMPKIERPFKVYIYCTYGNEKENYCVGKRGKVIGEFVCDRIDEFHEWELSPSKRFYEEEKSRLDLFLKESCLTYEEVCEYRKNLPSIKPLYGWHISDLKIYDKPKELSEFYSIAKNGSDCCVGCIYHETPNYEMPCVKCFCDRKYLTRPPQSWCYVKELQE